MLSLLYAHGCSVGICGTRPKHEDDRLCMPRGCDAPQPKKVTVVPMKFEPKVAGIPFAASRGPANENGMFSQTPRNPDGTTLRLANYEEYPDQELAPSEGGRTSDGSDLDDEIGRCHEELLKVTKRERRLMLEKREESQRTVGTCGKEVTPTPRSQKVEDQLQKMQTVQFPRRTRKTNKDADNAAAGVRSTPSDDDEDDDDSQDNEARKVDRCYEHLDIRGRMQHLRKVMDSGNCGMPMQANTEGRFDRQHTVDHYQAIMKRKLTRLAGEVPEFKQTSDPASAVCDAVAQYHGAASRLGVMFPEPGSENATGLSQEEVERLEQWRLDLQPAGDPSKRW